VSQVTQVAFSQEKLIKFTKMRKILPVVMNLYIYIVGIPYLRVLVIKDYGKVNYPPRSKQLYSNHQIPSEISV
jgi:hypothetical protein